MSAVMSPGLNRLQCADKLDQAALIVEQLGLNKGDFVDKATGAVCAAGAINIAVYGEPEYYLDNGPQLADLCVKESVLEHLGIALFGDDGYPLQDEDFDDRIATWNDADGTDATEVAATFRSVAADLREVAA